MDRKNSSIIVIGILAFMMLAGMVAAAGVSQPYWPGNPKVVYPGERGEIPLYIQNLVGDEDIIYKVSLVQNDGEIVSVKEGQYNVPFGTKDTEVLLKYKIPEDATIGTEYNIRLGFDSVVSGESSGAKIGTALELKIPFEVQDIEPLESPSSISWSLIAAIVVVVLALVVIIVLVTKRRGMVSQENVPQMSLR